MPFFLSLSLFFLLSVIVGWGVTILIQKLWSRLGLLDRPHLYKAEGGRSPAPYGVGVAISATLFLLSIPATILFDIPEILSYRLYIILTLTLLLSVVSWVDDMDTIRKSPISVPPLARLAMQILIGLVIGLTSIKISYVSNIFVGGVTMLDDYFFRVSIGDLVLTIYYIPVLVTIFWYVLVFNSINFSDGIPGLTGGFSLISFIILASLAVKLYMTDDSLLAQENSKFILILLSILIPVTFFVTRLDIGRKGIMGDSGTIILAFFIATISIVAGGKIATAMSALGVYLIDFVYVISARILSGKNPMKGDQTHHLHYRLLDLGLSQSSIRNLIYGLAGFFGVTAVFLDTGGKVILFVALIFVSLFLTKILSLNLKKK